MSPVILLGHGSPDPRSAAGLRSLARAVSRRSGLVVHAAFLDHDEPGLTAVAQELTDDGHERAIVVPAFLTSAYHVRSDIPRAIAHAQESTGLRPEVTAAVGPDPELITALDDRLPAGAPVLLACAGTRDARAQRELTDVAEQWSALRGTPVAVGHASMGTPDVATALAELARHADTRPVIASYVLFPGVLADRIRAAAAGYEVTEPIGDDAAGAVMSRLSACCGVSAAS